MKPTRLAVALVALSLAACGLDSANLEDFRNASPSRQGIRVAVPEGRQSQALSSGELGTTGQALLGEQATWYVVTRHITRAVNGGAVAILNLCEEIVKRDPTTADENKAVWGPHTASLSPNTYKFTVTKNSDGSFAYTLEGKPKSEPDSAYVVVLSGSHTPTSKLVGKGSFLLDWDAAQKLPEKPKEVGTAHFVYERNDHMDVTLAVEFRKVRDDETGSLVDADYAFAQVSGGDGSFEFVVRKDMQNNGSALERFAVKSRWHVDGEGRCDLSISGGELPASGVTGSECWDANFGRTYYSDSVNHQPTEGQESACAFSSASYTTL